MKKELFVLVFLQDSVRQVTMPHQLDRTSVFLAQPFLRDIRSRVIMQSLVYASDIFHHRQNRTDIMGNQDDSALFIDIFQELIKRDSNRLSTYELGSSKINTCGRETIERPNKTRCNWPPESSPMALPANSSNPICTITSLHALSGIY